MPLRTSRRSIARLWLSGALFGTAGCGLSGPSFAPEADSFARPADGLLERPGLQAVVDAGIRRDVSALLEFLRAPEPEVRARAAYQLASVPSDGTREALASALRDRDPRVRADAAFALGQLPDPAAGLLLLHALQGETNPAARRLLLEGIGKTGDGDALVRLLAAVRPADGGEELARALDGFARRRIGHPLGGPVLLDLVASEDPLVRELAAIAVGAALGMWGLGVEDVRRALQAMPEEGAAPGPLLVALGEAGHPEDTAVLLAWLERSGSRRTRVQAVLGLETAAARPEVRSGLFRALADPSPHVAATAAQILGSAGALAPDEAATWKRWIAENADRWQVASGLLPALVTAGEAPFVLERLRAWEEQGAPGWGAYPAVALIPGPPPLEILLRGLASPDRRRAYAATAALSLRLARPDAESSERERIFAAVGARLGAWGPQAPGSDLRGLLAVLRQAQSDGGTAATALRGGAARHRHPSIRGAVARDEPPRASPAPVMALNWEELRRIGPRPRIRISTAHGDIILQLDTEAAPLSVLTLVQNAKNGRYDGLTFHRVEANYILQSGDFDHEGGFGGPEAPIRTEISRIPFLRGTLGMASSGWDTEGSQYFVTHGALPSLDGRYTALGGVVEGMEAADRVALGDRILRVTVVGPVVRVHSR